MTIQKTAFEWEHYYWNKRYEAGRNSGAGSYGPTMRQKVDILCALPGTIKSIVEVGCGDFNFGRHLMDRMPTVSYDGFDVSDVIVTRNRDFYTLPRVRFHPMAQLVPWSDLLMCVDVLFHVREDEDYKALLEMLKDGWRKYLAVTAYEYSGPADDHLRIRKFHPEFFGKPIVREIIEEDGELYFYVFEK